jgi:hypothetical protein
MLLFGRIFFSCIVKTCHTVEQHPSVKGRTWGSVLRFQRTGGKLRPGKLANIYNNRLGQSSWYLSRYSWWHAVHYEMWQIIHPSIITGHDVFMTYVHVLIRPGSCHKCPIIIAISSSNYCISGKSMKNWRHMFLLNWISWIIPFVEAQWQSQGLVIIVCFPLLIYNVVHYCYRKPQNCSSHTLVLSVDRTPPGALVVLPTQKTISPIFFLFVLTPSTITISASNSPFWFLNSWYYELHVKWV